MARREIKSHLMTPKEVADYLGIELETLNNWRCTKRYNLQYVKAGRLVRYRVEDVEAFIASRMQGGAANDG